MASPSPTAIIYGYEGEQRLIKKSTCWFCDSAEYLSPFQSLAVVCRNSPPEISRQADPCCSGSPPYSAKKGEEEKLPAAAPGAPSPQTCIDRVISDGTKYFCKQFQRRANSLRIPTMSPQ